MSLRETHINTTTQKKAMIISVDTKNDSTADIQRAIAILQQIIGEKTDVTHTQSAP